VARPTDTNSAGTSGSETAHQSHSLCADRRVRRLQPKLKKLSTSTAGRCALGEAHPLDPWPKPPAPEAPLLREFTNRFLEYARLHVKESSFELYAGAVSRLLRFPELASAQISKINPKIVARYCGSRKTVGVSVSAINGDLRTLRRLLRLAFEWEIIPRSPVVHALPGERTRDRVFSFEDEQKYMEASGPNLSALTVLAVDTGMRPKSELFRLEWPQVHLEASEMMPNGYIKVKEGKTQSAERVLPLTSRARETLLILRIEPRRKRWVFPGPDNSWHLVSIQKSHLRAVKKAGLERFSVLLLAAHLRYQMRRKRNESATRSPN
jgi:hypothetical protein